MLPYLNPCTERIITIKSFIIDIETEAIINPQKVWMVVLRDVSNPDKILVYHNLHNNPSDLLKFNTLGLENCILIGHNIIDYDLPILERVCNFKYTKDLVIDTLVTSRLINYNISGRHSLDAWGRRLKVPKGDFHDFSKYSEEMEAYCIQDTLVTLKLYKLFEEYIHSDQWKQSLRIEHDTAFTCTQMKQNGFCFNIQEARKVYTSISTELAKLDKELISSFPPKASFISLVSPKNTAKGKISLSSIPRNLFQDTSNLSVGSTFSYFDWEVFNPASPKQIVDRLNEAGWKPTEKTKGHIQCERELRWCRDKERRKELQQKLDNYKTYGWKVSEENLLTLPKDAPEASRKLVQRLILASRKSTLDEWLKAYNPYTKRIHGNFNHIGAWTQRKSHNGPNMANIPSGDTPYAHVMRSMWCIPKGKLLVGVDADSIQLRILAHYMNDPTFTFALTQGKKEDGTDAHTINMKALGPICASRDDAKTFIYAWLLGAGYEKIAQILKCTVDKAKEACNNFLESYPGLKELKQRRIPEDARRGYFEGIDRRLVLCDNEHLMLAGYLQSGESISMKQANRVWVKELNTKGIEFKQVNDVHDEWQTEVEDNMEVAKEVAHIQAEALRLTGEYFNLNCPLAGSYTNGKGEFTIGDNWSITH